MRPNSTWTAAAVTAAALAFAPAAFADYKFDKSVPLAAGGTLSIRSEASGVILRGDDAAAAGNAWIAIRSNRDDFAEKFDVRVETPSPGRVEVRIEKRQKGISGWFSDGWNSRTRVEVIVPRNASAEIETSGGGVDVSNLQGSVDAQSSGGGVEAKSIGGAAKLHSSGGAISASGIGGDVDASSSGGGVEVFDAGGLVVAESSGGGVSVSFAAGNAKGGTLGSSGGGVDAVVDPKVGLDIDASSSGGSVDCDLPVTVRGRMQRDSIRGQLNGGGAVLKIRSSGGGVSVSGR